MNDIDGIYRPSELYMLYIASSVTLFVNRDRGLVYPRIRGKRGKLYCVDFNGLFLVAYFDL
jgi:hypothetical protein